MQVLSYDASPQRLQALQAIPLNKEANDYMAEVVQKYPKRLFTFATLPWSDPNAVAKELERAVKQLGLKGVLLSGRLSPDAVFLDSMEYQPILESAAA